MIRFAYLGSGSKGNAAIVQAGQTTLMIDCGLPLNEVDTRLERLGLVAGDVDAILVTHEHSDHVGGVSRLARRNGIPVFCTAGTRSNWPLAPDEGLTAISPHRAFELRDFRVQPYPVPHDAREPCQFVLEFAGRRVGVLTDAGAVTPHMRDTLDGLDALLLEFNHDLAMLMKGPYPPSLKKRVAGGRGHLSNAQAAALLRAIDCTRLQHLVLTHLSEKNNLPTLALDAAAEALGARPDWLVCAQQDAGLSWRTVS